MPDLQAIQSLLEREIDLISRFVSLLEQEQAALAAAEPDKLPAITPEKHQLVEQLNHLESERVQAVGGNMALNDRQRMEVWLAQHASNSNTSQRWEKLLALAKQAKSLNELNNQLVKTHLERTSKALAILTQRAQENVLYSSKGQTAIFTGSRIVDSA